MTRFFNEARDAYLLGPLRLALSTLLLWNTSRGIVELARGGYFGDFFHIPIVPEAWLPSATGYAVILAVQIVTGVMAFLGVWPRPALLTASTLGLFVLTLDRLQYHNNRYALLLLALLLGFTPCDRSWSIARRPHTLPRGERVASTLARRLFQAQVSLIYLSSACGKLVDADWRSGQVLFVRFASTGEFWAARGVSLPSSLLQLLSSAFFASGAAKLAIASELFLAVGMWLPRVRRFALYLGVVFHFTIEISARVELFSWLMVASYLAFVVPEVRERRFVFDAGSRLARALARVLALLDWCARFEIVPNDRAARTFAVTNRGGRTEYGLRGAALVAEAVPALFPFWLPLYVVSRTRKRERRSLAR